MADALRHRGPDDAGTWADAACGLALGHRRLAIVDLSPAGHQPMVSACGQFVIAFNGEIYNHSSLRVELSDMGAAPTWRGHSDTETLLAAIAHWGLEATLQRCVGMFALALWDCKTHTLTLARDRFGEKPLYYGWTQGVFVFGSELKALRAYPGFANPVSRQALAQYMRYLYVPAPLSIYEGIYKLEPGCLLTVDGLPRAAHNDEDTRHDGSAVHIKRWWSLADAVKAGQVDPIQDEAHALHLLEERLAEAVRLQSLADVPLGAFLSGGVDSSAIVALMQQQSSRRVQTFTIGFDEMGYDESSHARAVARHLGTEHHEMRVSAQMAQDVIAQLPRIYDEPFADSSQIPTHLVCQAAKQHVTVALSGDAGDELFGGYNRYAWGPRIWQRLGGWPHPMRQALASGLQALAPTSWDRLLGHAGIVRPGEKLHKLGRVLQHSRSLDELYTRLVTEWQDPAEVVKGVDTAGQDYRASLGMTAAGPSGPSLRASADEHADPMPPNLSAAERMMYRDSVGYLPDDILCKVDRAAMACSLETRVPFLDHRVAELAWRLPMDMKIRGHTSKWALRQVLYRYVPRELIERPKAGFAMPVGQWLRGPLRDWAQNLLAPERLQAEGYLHPAPVMQAWQEHLSGRYDHTAKLWAVLMFQAWLAENKAPLSNN